METLGTINLKLLGIVEVSGTGLGIIVAALLVLMVLMVLPIIRARK